jgi:hypothetical protein
MSSVAVGVVDRDAFGDRLHEHRLAGAGRGDDERALAEADGRDEVDRAAREFRAALRRPAGLERQATLGVARRERLEVGTARALDRVGAVERDDLGHRDAAAMVAAGARDDRIAAAQAVLPHEVRRDPGVARFVEIAVLGAADEAGITRGVEPAARLAVDDEDLRRPGIAFAVAAVRTVGALRAVRARPARLVLAIATATPAALATAATAAAAPLIAIATIRALATVLPGALAVLLLGGPVARRVGCARRGGGAVAALDGRGRRDVRGGRGRCLVDGRRYGRTRIEVRIGVILAFQRGIALGLLWARAAPTAGRTAAFSHAIGCRTTRVVAERTADPAMCCERPDASGQVPVSLPGRRRAQGRGGGASGSGIVRWARPRRDERE